MREERGEKVVRVVVPEVYGEGGASGGTSNEDSRRLRRFRDGVVGEAAIEGIVSLTKALVVYACVSRAARDARYLNLSYARLVLQSRRKQKVSATLE